MLPAARAIGPHFGQANLPQRKLARDYRLPSVRPPISLILHGLQSRSWLCPTPASPPGRSIPSVDPKSGLTNFHDVSMINLPPPFAAAAVAGSIREEQNHVPARRRRHELETALLEFSTRPAPRRALSARPHSGHARLAVAPGEHRTSALSARVSTSEPANAPAADAPARSSRPDENGELLRLTGVTKRFPGVVALDSVSFDLRRARCTPYAAKTARANRR